MIAGALAGEQLHLEIARGGDARPAPDLGADEHHRLEPADGLARQHATEPGAAAYQRLGQHRQPAPARAAARHACPGEWYHIPAQTEHAARCNTLTEEIEFWFGPNAGG